MTCKACLRRMLATRQGRAVAETTPIARSFSTHPSPSIHRSLPAGPSRSRMSARNTDHATTRRSLASLSTISSSSNVSIPRRLPLRHPQHRSNRTAAALAQAVEDFISPSTTFRYPLKVTPPSLEAIKEEGYLDDDVQLVPEDQAWIVITPEAIQQLEKITAKEPPELIAQDKLALRVGVESGGCHGYQYTMEIVEERGVDDYVMQPEGVNCIPVVIDLVSLGLLKGATLHHATELIGSSFRLQDNPQAKEGGNCGCGVSWELKA